MPMGMHGERGIADVYQGNIERGCGLVDFSAKSLHPPVHCGLAVAVGLVCRLNPSSSLNMCFIKIWQSERRQV